MGTVLITVDAVRVDHLAQYGGKRNTMPVLDRLTERGTLFESAFANGPHSGVSIPSFLTSRYRGVEPLQRGPNLATALSLGGVDTAAFHSNTMIAGLIERFAGFDTVEDFGLGEDASHDAHQPFSQSGLGRIYDRLKEVAGPILARSAVVRTLHETIVPAEHRFDYQVYVDANTLTGRTLEWVSTRDDREFFAWVHYMDPHRPYGIDPEVPAYGGSSPSDAAIRALMARAGQSPDEIDQDDEAVLRDLYDSDLRYTSSAIDRLLDGLERYVDLEETLVILTADHGEEFADHGQYFHRNYPYDELLQVPLVVNQSTSEPERISQQRELLDVAPTVCAHHDVTVPDEFRGTPLFSGDERRVISTGSLRTEAPVISVRSEGWKYIHPTDAADELYEIDTDPGERRNLAESAPDRVEAMKETIPERLLTTDGVDRPGSASGRTRRRLEDLGYLE